jgi:hypothetical protein
MWCGDSSLKKAFPGLYNMASMKDTPMIAANMDYSSDSLQWNISFKGGFWRYFDHMA